MIRVSPFALTGSFASGTAGRARRRCAVRRRPQTSQTPRGRGSTRRFMAPTRSSRSWMPLGASSCLGRWLSSLASAAGFASNSTAARSSSVPRATVRRRTGQSRQQPTSQAVRRPRRRRRANAVGGNGHDHPGHTYRHLRGRQPRVPGRRRGRVRRPGGLMRDSAGTPDRATGPFRLRQDDPVELAERSRPSNARTHNDPRRGHPTPLGQPTDCVEAPRHRVHLPGVCPAPRPVGV